MQKPRSPLTIEKFVSAGIIKPYTRWSPDFEKDPTSIRRVLLGDTTVLQSPGVDSTKKQIHKFILVKIPGDIPVYKVVRLSDGIWFDSPTAAANSTWNLGNPPTGNGKWSGFEYLRFPGGKSLRTLYDEIAEIATTGEMPVLPSIKEIMQPPKPKIDLTGQSVFIIEAQPKTLEEFMTKNVGFSEEEGRIISFRMEEHGLTVDMLKDVTSDEMIHVLGLKLGQKIRIKKALENLARTRKTRSLARQTYNIMKRPRMQ